jgi:hypothetical protein
VKWLQKILLFFLISAAMFAQAQERSVWQIGTFDQSPLEFSSTAHDAITFQVGKSDPHKDWPGTQGAGHPYRIQFPLDSPEGTYVLRIGTIVEQPRIPTLRIDVNGHAGTFYLHPDLTYFPGDGSFAYHPNYSKATVNASIPASFLKAGENMITITCVDQPAALPEEEQFSAITYDALRLDTNRDKKSSAESPTVKVAPTVFYQKMAGGLAEIVDAFISTDGPLKPGLADLEFRGKHYAEKLPGSEFGEQRVSFSVPEWSGVVTAHLRIPANSAQVFDATLKPERKWTIFVVPHTHLDVGYTDYQGKVAETQSRVLTQAANLIHQHPGFRFSMDGSWNLQQLLQTRPPHKQKEILDLIRSGRMAMPAQYCNLLTGYASLETLYRSLYESRDLARRYGLPFEYANITDVPTYSGSYPSILASSGVKYWVAAANNDRAPIFYHEHWNEKSPFWWQGPDGKKVLFWYSWAYLQTQTLFGLPPGLNAVRESLPIFLQAYSNPAYKLDVALIYGTQVENTDLYPATATFATAWNESYVYPKLTYSTFPAFFHYIDQHYGKDLPTYKGDGGPYWEDGFGSDAYFAAEDRLNQNRALSAEVLSTVTHTVDHDLNPPSGLLDDIWRNIVLFSEHTWASYNSITQPDHEETMKQLRVKDSRADRASLEIEDVMNRSLSQLADQIHIPANTLVVFNSLNWQRDALVETDLFENPKLVDLSTKQPIPFEVLYRKERFLHVRFLAKDLPPVGYKCFSIVYGTESPAKPQISKDPLVENRFYRVKVDQNSGAVASIYDKQLQRELVDAHSPYKFGQYLYVTGGDGSTRIINPYPSWPMAKLDIHSSSNGKLLGVEQLPWGQAIRMSSSSVNTPKIETEVLLYNDQKKIEFRYRLDKQYTTAKEAAYFAFPVAASNPSFSYASQQGWVDPAHDMFKGGSPEWFSVHQWMAVHDSDLAVGIVPLDASLASFGDINRGKWPANFSAQTGTLFSYVMNNYWDTNYRAGQGSDFTFRYTMTSGPKLDGGALTRLGTEAMRPAELNYVVAQDKAGNPPRPLPAGGEGFLRTSASNVALITWKQAQNGNGTILRLAETAGHATEADIKFLHSTITSARLCSGVEDDRSVVPLANDNIHISFKPFEVLTIRAVEK